MKSALQYDQYLFKVINYQWHNHFFDWLMPFLRHATLWVPLYFFLFIFAIVNFKKKSWYWILFACFTAVVTNFVSSDLIKENIMRIRPCNEPSIASWVRILVAYKPQSSSFTSSHATNHFGIATFFYLTLRNHFKIWPFLFFVWALLICYAQVYVGVHYPIDVMGGAVIGIFIGYLLARLFNKSFGLPQLS